MGHLLGVGSAKLLDVSALGLGEPMSQPGDLGRGVRLLIDRLACRLVFLPHGYDHERQDHSVDHAQGRVDETGHVVVGLSRGGGNEALHQLQADERDEASPTDHKYAINYGGCQR